ncbi:hypothetical protein BS17DRAFT_808403 [Gyrodon lividus]|nr:hypothetical protein BS17DRAFT_808403 [Gyrodon lividus]
MAVQYAKRGYALRASVVRYYRCPGIATFEEVREKKICSSGEMSVKQDPVDGKMNEGEVILPERCRRKEWKRGQSCKISSSVNAWCHTISQRQIGTPTRQFGAERCNVGRVLKQDAPLKVVTLDNPVVNPSRKMEEMDNSFNRDVVCATRHFATLSHFATPDDVLTQTPNQSALFFRHIAEHSLDSNTPSRLAKVVVARDLALFVPP